MTWVHFKNWHEFLTTVMHLFQLWLHKSSPTVNKRPLKPTSLSKKLNYHLAMRMYNAIHKIKHIAQTFILEIICGDCLMLLKVDWKTSDEVGEA